MSTRGPRPNADFISTLGSGTLTSRGTVKVLPTLQLPSHPNIYAAGDVIDWDEQKQAAKYGAHAAVIVANILSATAGKTPVAKYKGSFELMAVTDGKVRLCASFRFGFTEFLRAILLNRTEVPHTLACFGASCLALGL